MLGALHVADYEPKERRLILSTVRDLPNRLVARPKYTTSERRGRRLEDDALLICPEEPHQ